MSVYYPDDPDYSRGFYNSNNPELWKVMRKNTELRGQLKRKIADQFEMRENGVADLGSMEDNIREKATMTPSVSTPAYAATSSSSSSSGSVIPSSSSSSSSLSSLGSMAKGAFGTVANGLYQVGSWAVQDPPSQNDIPAVVEYDRNLQREANRAIIALAQQGRPIPQTLPAAPVQPAPAQPIPVQPAVPAPAPKPDQVVNAPIPDSVFNAPVQDKLPDKVPALPPGTGQSVSSSNVKLIVDKGIKNELEFANAFLELKYTFELFESPANNMKISIHGDIDNQTAKYTSVTGPIKIGKYPVQIKGGYIIASSQKLLLSKPNTIILCADTGTDLIRLLGAKIIQVIDLRTVAKFYHSIGALNQVDKITATMKLNTNTKSNLLNIASHEPDFFDPFLNQSPDLKAAGISEPRMNYAIRIADNYDDLADRLAVLVGSQRSGNQSKQLKNEGLAIIDKLRVSKQITREQYQQLYKLFV